jgi:hypothetical protein
VDLTEGGESPADVVERAKAQMAAAALAKPKDAAPAWVSKMGTPRIMAEFRSMKSEWDGSPEVYDLQLVDDCAVSPRRRLKSLSISFEGAGRMRLCDGAARTSA